MIPNYDKKSVKREWIRRERKKRELVSENGSERGTRRAKKIWIHFKTELVGGQIFIKIDTSLEIRGKGKWARGKRKRSSRREMGLIKCWICLKFGKVDSKHWFWWKLVQSFCIFEGLKTVAFKQRGPLSIFCSMSILSNTEWKVWKKSKFF